MVNRWDVGAVIMGGMVGGAITISYCLWTCDREYRTWLKERERAEMLWFSSLEKSIDVSEEKVKEEVHQPSPPEKSIVKAIKLQHLLHDLCNEIEKVYHFIEDVEIVKIYGKNLMELDDAHIAGKTMRIIEKDEQMLTPGSTVFGHQLVLMVEEVYEEYVKYLRSAGPNPLADFCEMPGIAEMKKGHILKAMYTCTEEFREKYCNIV